jgi:type IV pilus assembly protein PilM
MEATKPEMFDKRRTGWIGIDIGTSTVKLVQLILSRDRIRIAGSAIVPRHTAWPVVQLSGKQPLSSADEMQVAISLHTGFRGKRAAALLPMAVCDLFSMERPPVRLLEQDRSVRQAIELATQASAAHLQYDIWDAESDPQSKNPPKSNVLSVARDWTDQLCEDVSQSGWWCQTVDGLPLALARAVAMVERNGAQAPVAALDWGYGRATLCIIVEGRSVYVRCLKDCGLHLLMDSLSQSLHVTVEETLRLLQGYGIAVNVDGASQETSELIGDIITPWLARLEEEIKRTISHIQGQRRTINPEKLYLFGGGATINGLAEYLTRQIAIDVKIWQFGAEGMDNSAQPGLPSCLFGPAIALSALAWEPK